MSWVGNWFGNYLGGWFGSLFTAYLFNAIFDKRGEAGAAFSYSVALLACYVLSTSEGNAIYDKLSKSDAVFDYKVLFESVFDDAAEVTLEEP